MAKLWLILALLAAAAPGLAAAQAPPTVTITLAGEAEVVFDWSRQACETWDIPDAPARAFRDAAGAVRLIATHFVNRAAVGPDLDSLAHDCAPIFAGGQQDAPQAFDDRAWLSGFFTEDGQTVYALVHNEFQGHHRPALCPSKTYIRCWRNAVTFALSNDGGRSFRQPDPPAHLIATPPYRYEGDVGRHVGYFSPTNIIRHDGAYFALFSAAAYGDQEWGACLMRRDLGWHGCRRHCGTGRDVLTDGECHENWISDRRRWQGWRSIAHAGRRGRGVAGRGKHCRKATGQSVASIGIGRSDFTWGDPCLRREVGSDGRHACDILACSSPLLGLGPVTLGNTWAK